MPQLSPAVQRRRLRAELRSARQAAGLTQEQVATAMDWSQSKVIRIEGGAVGISTNDLKALLAYYQITDDHKVESLIALARGARERSWWSGYLDVAPQAYLRYIEYETAAFAVQAFQPLIIPGMLQTYDYARTVILQFAAHLPEEHVDKLLELRMRRQEILESPDQPQFFYVLDEAAVRRMVGGRAILRDQLLRLVALADRPNLSIELIPFGAGAHPGTEGNFTILEFDDDSDDVLFQENSTVGMIQLTDRDIVLGYRETFQRLRAQSLGPAESVTYIDAIAGDLVD